MNQEGVDLVYLKVLFQRLHVGHKIVSDNSRYPAQIRNEFLFSSVNYRHTKIFGFKDGHVMFLEKLIRCGDCRRPTVGMSGVISQGTGREMCTVLYIYFP
jgi:hypothetical protein